MSWASATQTLAWAAATISGRASESRKAVARLIGKRKSVGSSGAALSFIELSTSGGIELTGWFGSTARTIRVRPEGGAVGWPSGAGATAGAGGGVGWAPGNSPSTIVVDPASRTRWSNARRGVRRGHRQARRRVRPRDRQGRGLRPG